MLYLNLYLSVTSYFSFVYLFLGFFDSEAWSITPELVQNSYRPLNSAENGDLPRI